MRPLTVGLAIVCLLLACSERGRAEEIWLHDNSRLYGLVQGIEAEKLVIQLHSGERKSVPLEEVVAIRFMGRPNLMLQSGVQEFRFVQGGKLRGRIVGNESDLVVVESALAGTVRFDAGCLKGFVALPVMGFVGRKSEELVDGERGSASASIDLVLDRRGTLYPCVISRFERAQIFLDYEESAIEKPIQLLYLSGVRLADSARKPVELLKDEVRVRVTGRDGSVVDGLLERIHMGRWYLRPDWNREALLAARLDEIVLVQTIGGRVQYLSQLDPQAVEERTRLTPVQPYRRDVDVQGFDLSIAGRRFPWGLGVHANSDLAFGLNGRFKTFHCEVGIASRMGRRGSVVFQVMGDGKELFKSPVVRGGDEALAISVSVEGVKRLELKAADAGDLDLGDAAIWGAARVVR